jgi:DNA replication protein DnaC
VLSKEQPKKRDAARKGEMGPIDTSLRLFHEELMRMRNDPEVQKRAREVEEADARRAARERQAKIDKVLSLSIIGDRFMDRTFENFTVSPHNEKAFAAAKAVAADPTRGVVFYGPSGTGKTHLAGAIAHECIARGTPAIVNTVGKILSRVRGTFNNGGRETESSFMDSCADVKVLILDDLGKETLTAWSARFFWELINARYERNLPIIATSNIPLEKLTQQYLAPIPGVDAHIPLSMIDRMEEMWGEWIPIRGESRRSRNKNPQKTKWEQ